jgi:hypothetical protein
MPNEFHKVEALWQCVMSSHLKWSSEIEGRLCVEIEISSVSKTGFGHVFAYGQITGANSAQAREEMGQCEDHLEDLYYSIKTLQGDPLRGWRRYRHAADLYGRTPWDALIESGCYHIECVLIGPDARVAAMLAEEPRLLASARDRVLHSHDLDSFTPHVQQIIAAADSILAAKAFEGVLLGRI